MQPPQPEPPPCPPANASTGSRSRSRPFLSPGHTREELLQAAHVRPAKSTMASPFCYMSPPTDKEAHPPESSPAHTHTHSRHSQHSFGGNREQRDLREGRPTWDRPRPPGQPLPRWLPGRGSSFTSSPPAPFTGGPGWSPGHAHPLQVTALFHIRGGAGAGTEATGTVQRLSIFSVAGRFPPWPPCSTRPTAHTISFQPSAGGFSWDFKDWQLDIILVS